ncbi:MAG: IclR family transcriptional regulator [Treponema sp.]|jgi:DNA-binding IclR family transcriptional regulator|nr:IclR family transcriptional regulator [Treponema sp.]
MEDEKYNIKAVARCLKILDLLGASDLPLNINDVCAALDMNINMAFRMLSTLVSAGYVVKDEKTGLYSNSLKTLQLSRNALLSLNIRKYAMPYMELLWNQYSKANINLALLYEGDVLVIDRLDSICTPRTYFTPGKTSPFHCTALGKILTCELDEVELDKIIVKKGLKAFTQKTITDPVLLKVELAKVRAEHLSRDRAEYIPQDNCIAVPIRNQEGKIIAAVSLTAFESYMTVEEIEETIPALRNTAQRISFIAGYQNGIA